MKMPNNVIDKVKANRQKLQEKAINIFGTGTICMLEYLRSEKKDTRYVFDVNIGKDDSKHIFYNIIIIELGEIEVVINIYAERQNKQTMKAFDNFVRYVEKTIKNSLKKLGARLEWQ